MKVPVPNDQVVGRLLHEHRSRRDEYPAARWMFIHAQAKAGRPRRILIVDDEEDVAWTIHDGLERLPNCELQVALSGEQAWQLFTERPFDLLITDYKMPGLDGLALSARVRQHYPHSAIILITAYSNDELRQQARHIAIRHILDKPVTLAQIRSTAAEALEHGAENQDRFAAW